MKKLKIVAKITDEQFLKQCEKIAEMTDNNDHTTARVEGAKLLKDFGYPNAFVKLYGCIKTCHDIEKHLPHSLNQYRAYVDRRMWKFAEKVLNPELHDAFMGAY